MAERGGQLGNTNATKNRPWRLAIDRALQKISRVEQVNALDEIAEKVVNTARKGPSYEKGDPWLHAVGELADRLDGRAAQSLSIDGDLTVTNKAAEITDDKLAEIASASR